MDRRKIRDAARDMQNQFQQAGDASGRALSQGITSRMPEVEKALDKATVASGKLLVEQQKLNTMVEKGNVHRDKLVAQSQRVASAYHGESSAIRDVENALRRAQPAGEGFVDNLLEIGSALGKLSKFSGPITIAAIAAGLVELTGIAAQASGAIGLLPGAIGGAVSAFGTLKLATVGFGDAIESIGDPEKFAEAIGKLSPNAQQAALSIQQLMPTFTQLKNATQDALFAGVGPQLQQMTQTLMPIVQQTTTSIAASFNDMFKGITNQLMTPETVGALEGFGKNIGETFRALTPAVAPLMQAFTQIAQVGSSFMPQLASAASQAAQSFANFISEASRSGQLQQWIQDGITVMRQMMSVVGELGHLFFALGPEGQRAMNEIKTAVVFTSDAVRALNGDVSALKDLFPTMGDIAVNVFNRIGSAIDTFILGPLRMLGNLPGLGSLKDVHIQQFTTDHLTGGPLGGPLGGPGVSPGTIGYPSGDPNKPMQWVPGQGWMPAGGGGLPVPMGAPGVGSGVLGGSSSGRGGTGAYTWGNPPPKDAAGPGGRLGQAPAVPYDQTLPPEFAQLPQTAEILGAENAWLGARHQLAEKQARVTQLEQTVTATESDRIGAANDVIEAQQAQNEALLRVNTAAQNLYEKNNKQLSGYADQMGEIGAQLDKDLGISKGLPGIADNLVRFLASLAAAPLMGQLSAISGAPGQAQGGYGLMGVLGAQGAFGPQYTAAGQAAASASSSSSAPYSASAMGPAALRPGGAYPGDAALLANVPAGSYTQTQGADLTQGLADCSSAVEDLVNLLDGRPTSGRSMSTGNEAQWLTEHGFQPGMGGPGDFRVGFNSGHTQATLPGGTPFNWGSDSAAARGGVGGTGADDPAFTSHYFRPAGAGPTNLSGVPVPSGLGAPPTPSGPSGPSFPIPLPVTIVGGGGGGLAGIPGIPGAPPAGPGSPAPGQSSQGTPGGPAVDPFGPGGALSQLPPGGPVPGPGQPGWGAPGLPAIPAGGGGGSGFMGLGGPGAGAGAGPPQGAALGTPPMGMAPAAHGSGGAGGVGLTPGGSIDTAMGMAASALDVLAPGAGQAAQTGMKLANRAIQYAGQVAGIGASGLMETFLPAESPLANAGNSWLGRVVGGIVSAGAALPNTAGQLTQQQQQQVDPNTNQHGQGQGQPPGPVSPVHIEQYNVSSSEDRAGADLARHQMAANGGTQR